MKPTHWTLLGWVRLIWSGFWKLFGVYLSLKVVCWRRARLWSPLRARARTPAPPEAISFLLETRSKTYKRFSRIQILVWITLLELLLKLTCALRGFDCVEAVKLSPTVFSLWERITRTSFNHIILFSFRKTLKNRKIWIHIQISACSWRSSMVGW